MKVILLEKNQLGNLGDHVQVRPGYARNYLIPQGKATRATQANIAVFEARRVELEKQANHALAEANARKEALIALGTVTLRVKSGEEGKLYGSVGTRDIAGVITTTGVKVAKNEVLLPNGAIRSLGEYQIRLQLHSDVSYDINFVIDAE